MTLSALLRELPRILNGHIRRSQAPSALTATEGGEPVAVANLPRRKFPWESEEIRPPQGVSAQGASQRDLEARHRVDLHLTESRVLLTNVSRDAEAWTRCDLTTPLLSTMSECKKKHLLAFPGVLSSRFLSLSGLNFTYRVGTK